MQITPDDWKRSKLVKPGWFPLLIKEVVEELNSKKDAMNIVLDLEVADSKSEYLGTPIKHWLSEKGVYMPGGAASLAKAFNPTINEAEVADIEFGDYKGRYIYGKIKTDRGQDGNGAPRNVVEDWAPLPKQWAELANAVTGVAATVGGFGS
jgi:hypothetical protein